jgi:very-short-patch-repair endonuclease
VAQHGVVGRRQLLEAGVSGDAIDRRLRSGVLLALPRGVYAVGHRALPVWGTELAAVLACGRTAGVSHASGVAAYGMVHRDPERPVDVTVWSGHPRSTAGITVHRVSERVRLSVRFGVPVVSAVRALAGYATQGSPRDVERAFEEGRAKDVITPGDVARYLAAHPGGPGTAALRPLITPDRPSSRSRSPAEEWLLPHLRRSGLPAPEWNFRIGAFTVDSFWRAQRLVVEVDGFPFHTGRVAFERDHEKDLVLRRMRLDVMRFTARQVKREPLRAVVDIAGELARRQPPAA